MYIIYRAVGAGHARPAAFTAAAPLSNGFAGRGLDRLTAPPLQYKTGQGTPLPCAYLLRLLLFPCLHQMPYRQHGMVEQHPRAAPTHDLADMLPHFGLIAMGLADAAKRLGRHVRAVVHPRIGVVPQSWPFGVPWLPRQYSSIIRPTVSFSCRRFFSGVSGTPPPTTFLSDISSFSHSRPNRSCRQYASSMPGGIPARRSCLRVPRPGCAG